MDTAWIQVFVLSLTECVAPAGKTVCQESQLEIEFLSREQCELAREELVSLKAQSETVIIKPEDARCIVSARQHDSYETLADVDAASRGLEGWTRPEVPDRPASSVRASHNERLASLESCDATGGQAPCKIGEIIIEAGSVDNARPVEVWRRDK